VDVFVREIDNGDLQHVEKICIAAGISNFRIFNLKIDDPTKRSDPADIGIAFGEKCGRLVKSCVEKLIVLPPIDKLKPTEKNRDSRKKAWEQLKQFIDELRGQDIILPTSWKYAILPVGDKRICVYEGQKPPIEADIYISKDESALLLKLKEAFKADAVVIAEKEI